MSYKAIKELDTYGFSINSLHKVIQGNNAKRTFNTLDYFTIGIAMGDVEIQVDQQRFLVQSGELIFLGPSKNVTFGRNCEMENRLYSITFSSSFFELSNKDSLLLHSKLFINDSYQTTIVPFVASCQEMKKLFVDKLEVFKSKGNKSLYISAAHNFVEMLILDGLLKTITLESDQGKSTAASPIQYTDKVNKFRILLQRHYKEQKKVVFYADALYVTPRRLSEMTEAFLGKTAKQVINDKVINEVKRSLKYANLTISEIACEMGFSGEGNFSSFVKKHTKKTPSELRANLRVGSHKEMKNI